MRRLVLIFTSSFATFDVGVAHDFPNWDEKNKGVGN